MPAFHADFFHPDKWTGAKPIAPSAAVALCSRRKSLLGIPRKIVPTSRWLRACVPATAQRTDDCVGYGTANLGEGLVRGYLRPSRVDELVVRFLGGAGLTCWQVHGNGIWRMRKDDLNEPYAGGITVDGGLLALIKRRVVSASDLRHTATDLLTLSERLRKAPVLLGHRVHEGWGKPGRNGAIDARGQIPGLDGHCTLCCNVFEQYHGADGLQRYLDEWNSWGFGYGWHGLCTLMESDHLMNCIGPGATLEPDAGDPEGWAEALMIALGEAGLLVMEPSTEH